MSAVLVDTNVLIYVHDGSEPQKQSQAARLLDEMASEGTGRLCAQVLSEYLSVVARKFAHVLNISSARGQAAKFAQLFTVYDTTPAVVLEAARGVDLHGLSYYDAQIWAVAKLNGIPLVLSENFTHGSEIEGVRFENPFLE